MAERPIDHMLDICMPLAEVRVRGRWTKITNREEGVCRAVLVAQLEERSLPTPEIRSSNPVIGKLLNGTFVFCQLVSCIERTKIKKKRPGWPIFFKKECGLQYKCEMLPPCLFIFFFLKIFITNMHEKMYICLL